MGYEGKVVKCIHCDGTGQQQGPGGKEACCHCRGKGERYFEFPEDYEIDDFDARSGMTEDERRWT